MDSDLSSAEVAAIPSELIGRVPRRTRLSQNSLLSATIGTVMLLVGLALAFATGRNALQAMRNREALRQAGSQVIGNNEVIGTIDALTSGRRGGGRVQYSFTAADGAMYEGRAQVPDDMFSGLLVSSSISIRYLPSNPTVNHPSAWEESDFSIWGTLLAPAIFVASGLFSLLSLRGDRRLVAEGTPVIATVTACSGPVGRSVWFSVKYEFRTDEGIEINGSGRYGSSLDIGTKLVALYLPQNPQRNAPYASSYYRATG
jgi:hypothetical protein